MEHGPFEDVFPIKNGDIKLLYVSLPEGTAYNKNPGGSHHVLVNQETSGSSFKDDKSWKSNTFPKKTAFKKKKLGAWQFFVTFLGWLSDHLEI